MNEGKILLTGMPRSGKSTAFTKCVRSLEALGYSVVGFSTPEIIERGKRTGFKVVDISSRREAILAKLGAPSRFRVGRYGVYVENFEAIALPILNNTNEEYDVLCIDEIGRMELYSEPFRKNVQELLRGPKPMLCVLHRNYLVKYGRWGKVIHVTVENRDKIPNLVMPLLSKYLDSKS
jgi:nucleoside-triphosphatase